MKTLNLIFIILTFLFHINSSAQNVNESKSKIDILDKQTKTSPLSISLGISSTTNLIKVGALEHSAESALTIAPVYDLPNGNSIMAASSLLKLHDGSEELSLTNTSLALNFKSKKIMPDLSWGGGLLSVLPTNEADRINNSFNGSLGIATSLTKSGSILKKPSNVSYAIKATKNFHTYSQNNMLQANTSHSVSQSMSWTTDMAEKLSVNISGAYTMGFTYLNNFKSIYGLSQTIDLQLPNHLNLSLTHSNGGSALGANGRDLDISFFDNRTSSLSISLNWVL